MAKDQSNSPPIDEYDRPKEAAGQLGITPEHLGKKSRAGDFDYLGEHAVIKDANGDRMYWRRAMRQYEKDVKDGTFREKSAAYRDQRALDLLNKQMTEAARVNRESSRRLAKQIEAGRARRAKP